MNNCTCGTVVDWAHEPGCERGPRHCDDYIRDKAQPKALRKFLLYKRIPAYWQIVHWKDSWGIPALFATLTCPHEEAKKHCEKYDVRDGKRVRVVMASRFGDVGITHYMGREHGYEVRVPLEWLKDFSEEE